MKKSILVLASLLVTGAYAQDYNKWSIDVNGGVNKPITPLSSGYATSTPSFWGANVGVRYMLNNKFGLRLGGGYESFTEKKDTPKFDSYYWNVNLQGYANLGRVLSFEDWTSDITLLLHAGGGYSQLKSDNLSKGDQMLFGTIGLTPEIRLSNRISLLLDGSLYVNTKQNRTYDTFGTTSRRGFQGAHLTGTIGLNIALGKAGQHADWAVTSSAKDDEDVAKRVAALENNVADLKDKVGNKQDKMNDANGNGIPDEIENYLNNNYQAKGGSTAANNAGDSGVVADLIRKGYVSAYFDFNSSKPQTASTWAIDIIVKYMKENTGAQVTISGYADELGGTNYNTTLSQKRANAVKDLLVKAGIDASRISTEGKGEDTSVDKNSAGARQIARRATFNLK